MKITEKHKVKDLSKFNFLLSHSEMDLMSEVKKFDLPEKIGFEDSAFRTFYKLICKKINSKKVFEQRVFDIKDFNEISIEDMITIWDISDNEQLVILTARIFLEIEDEKKISKLPLIDFLRLTSHLETISKLVANEFKKISRESKDPKIRNILSKYKGSAFDMLDRFCRLYPAYKIEEVKKMDWNTVLQAFISETKHNDIQTEINEL